MIEAPHYSAAGASKKAVSLPEALFDGTVNQDVLHRAVITFLSNQRQGTSDTKTRSEVSGGNQKPWRQKGTGRARQGSTRAPHWRHGGIAHGPHPRSYRLGIPKKMRQLAKKSALNARVREGALVVVDALEYEKPKTKEFATSLGTLGLAGKTLIVDSLDNDNLILSSRNVRHAKIVNSFGLNIYDLLYHDQLVLSRAAADELEKLLGAGNQDEQAEVIEEAPAKPKRTRKTKKEEAA